MTYNYLLFDLPSDHEVEGVLDRVRRNPAILANNGEGRNVKVIKATTSEGTSPLNSLMDRSRLCMLRAMHVINAYR